MGVGGSKGIESERQLRGFLVAIKKIVDKIQKDPQSQPLIIELEGLYDDMMLSWSKEYKIEQEIEQLLKDIEELDSQQEALMNRKKSVEKRFKIKIEANKNIMKEMNKLNKKTTATQRKVAKIRKRR